MLGWFRKKDRKDAGNVPPAEPILSEDILTDSDGESDAVSVSSDTATVETEPAPEDLQPVDEESCNNSGPIANEVHDSPPVAKEKRNTLFSRLQAGLVKTRTSLVYRLDTLFLGKKESFFIR